ncbi:hypothetical protein [uncultured Tenacibaculum sp.]|uniref:GTP pyrophosphokinase n=1 Tax=uncultured Tenacibaculum sp. TaxID=174713 RepID=UPI00260ADA5B|nr:hypothetical protein [uncultured Tenacibaculum sp.]
MSDYLEEYKIIRPNYERFQNKLTELLKELILESDIEIVSIESRTKTIESFKEKINRPDKNYNDPINDITDLCGVRIITYYTEDIYKIAELIENEFKIDSDKSVDKTKINTPDKFGYLSLHYILNLGKKRDNLVEWKAFKTFTAEIQIRTILQHSWAAIDHKLRYKTKGEIPSLLKRKIYRLSALLELADEQFLSIKNETSKLNYEIEDSIDKGELNLEFNRLSLSSYLLNNSKIIEITKLALEIGFKEDLEPEYNLTDAEDEISWIFLSRLIETLNQSSLKTLRDLDNFINNHESLVENLKKFKKQFDSLPDSEIYAVPTDLLVILIIMGDENINISNQKLRKAIDWPPLLITLDKVLKNKSV